MHIRSYNHPDDEAAVFAVFDRTFARAHPFLGSMEETEARQLLLLLLKVYQAFVAEVEGALIGFVVVDEGGYISNLYVDSAYAGCGAGSALLEATQEGRESLSLHVFAENAPAVRFYRARGFVEVCEDWQVDLANQRHLRLLMERCSASAGA